MYQLYEPTNNVKTPFLFFTGKGGVGKTSVACSTAVSLADEGKRVLLVSTDPASNLQDVLEMELTSRPIEIPSVKNLFACNIDPEEAAYEYREKTVGPYRDKLPESVIAQMEEQLSGACTVEIAAFDEFSHLLADETILKEYDYIIFDTAPTGHTLRLLSLPNAWNGFLEESTHGASCLGPLSGLGDKKEMYQKAVQSLSDHNKTTLMLVARPEESTLFEANRAARELSEIGIQNQMLIINGLLQSYVPDDEISSAFYKEQQIALKRMPDELKQVRIVYLPYVSYSLTGIDSLKGFVNTKIVKENEIFQDFEVESLANIQQAIDDFAERNTRVIFTMGKGGVGKTSVASLIALGLAEKGLKVHLTTTDPASHLDYVFKERTISKNLSISSINPEIEVEKYKKEVITKAGEHSEEELDYLQEDLESPCTEEIAVFRAFADVVARAENEVIVIDTAPTGHTLLLLDSSEAYHKEMSRSTGDIPESVKNLLPRLRNPDETEVVIVTLAEATPVFESKRLQKDLGRAQIHPNWWVINRSLYATNTVDPILRARAGSELQWINKVQEDLAGKCALIPWVKDVEIGSNSKMLETNM